MTATRKSTWRAVALMAALAFTECNQEVHAASDAGARSVLPMQTLRGTVRLLGRRPSPGPPPRNLSAPAACGNGASDLSLTVSPRGELEGVVVWIDAPEQAFSEKVLPTPMIDQRACIYRPAILAARAGSTVTFINSDPLIHNVRGLAGDQGLFNFAQPLEGQRTKKVLPAQPAEISLKCDVHPWMRAHVKTFLHPYFTQADASGRFVLEAPGNGPYQIHFWHPRLPLKTVLVASPAQPLRVEWQAAELRLH